MRICLMVGLLITSVAATVAADPQAPQRAEREDTRTQFPALLVNTYVGFDVGLIQYDFTEQQLEPGFAVASVSTPPIAVRAALVGHRFNKYLSAQLTYMRPVLYVSYKNINGDQTGHHLFTHFGGVTLKPEIPLTDRLSAFGEAGLGITSRRQLTIGDAPAIKEANFASALFGGGVAYHLTGSLDLTGGMMYLRQKASEKQPHTIFWSGGMRYTVRPLPAATVEANRQSGASFPEHLLQLEYTTGVGYGVNDFVSKKVPIFWGGNVKVARGFAVHYDRNVFHTKKIFSFDVGASVSAWRSRDNREKFMTASVYPLLRFTVLRLRTADVWVSYSLAGPTYLSRVVIDQRNTGKRFTFQDFVGIGAFLGPNRRVSASLKINHYSNGNIFTHNAGIKVPLTVGIGYTF